MNTLSNISFKGLKASGRKNLLVIISIVLSTCLITCIGVFAVSLQSMLVKSTIEQTGGSYHGIYTHLTKNQSRLIKQNEKVEKVGETLSCGTVFQKGKTASVEISYMDNNCINMRNIFLQKGRFPHKDNEIAMEKWVLRYFNIKPQIGTRISIPIAKYSDPDKAKVSNFKLSGIIKTDSERKRQNISMVLVSKRFVSANQNGVTRMCYIRVKDGYDAKYNVAKIAKETGLKEWQRSTNDTYIKATGGDISINITAAIIGLIVIIATVIVIYNIFYISIIEKTKQFGLLAALGTTKKQIRKIVFKEGLILSTISIPLGILLGHIISMVIIPLLSITYLEMKFSIYVILVSALVTLFTIIIALRRPQKLAARISPIEAIRFGSAHMAYKKKSRNLFKKVSLIKMAFLNIGRNKKRTIMTILSLSTSGILFLMVCGVLQSMDIDNLAKTTLNHEFCLSPNINKTVIKDIHGIKGVKRVIPVRKVYEVHAGKVIGDLYGFDDYTLYRIGSHIVSGDRGKTLINDLKNKNGIIIEQHENEECPYSVGDKVKISIKKYDDLLKKEYIIKKNFIVSAIVKDDISDIARAYRGYEFMTSDNAYIRITGDREIDSIYIKINKNYYSSIRNKIKTIAADDNLLCESETEMKNTALSQLRGIEVTLLGLTGIIALIGTMNLINTIITSIISRKKEFGMLQAVGLSNRQMRKMLQIEGLYYSVISSMAGMVLGTAAGYMGYKLLVSAGADYAVYKLPLIPFLIMIVLAVSTQVIITYMVQKNMRDKSIIDRIRFSD